MRTSSSSLLLDSSGLWMEMSLPSLAAVPCCHRISQVGRKVPSRIIEYNSWLHVGPPKIQLYFPFTVITEACSHFCAQTSWWSGSLLVRCSSTCRHLFQIHCCLLLCFETLVWISSPHRISQSRAVLLYYYHSGKFGADCKQEGWLVNFLQDCSYCQYLRNVSGKKALTNNCFSSIFMSVS